MPLLGLVLIGTIASGLLGVLPPFLRFLVVFSVFSYLPGEAALRRVFRGSRFGTECRVPLSTLIGLSGSAVIGWLCALLGIDFHAYVVILQCSAGLVFGALLWPSFKTRGESPAPGAIRARPARSAQAAALALVALGVALFYGWQPPSVDPRGDSLDHLGYIRNIVAENRMEPEDVLAPAVFAGDEPMRGDPRKGMMHPLLAAVSVLSSLEPLDVWRWMPVVLAPLAFLGFAALSLVLLPSGGFVFGALLLFLMFQGGMARQFLGVIAYGQHLALVYYWLLIVMFVRYASSPDRRLLVVIALLCLGGSLVHLDVAIHASLMYAGILPFHRKFGASLRSALNVGFSLAIAVTIAVVWKLWTSGGAANVLHAHPQGLMYFGDIGSRFFVPSPAEILRRNGLVFFAGLFLIPILPLVGRHSRFGRCGWMNFALALPPCLIALNPLVAPVVYREGTYLLHRFVLNIPAFIITALVLGSAVAWARSGRVWKKALAALLLVAWSRPFVVAAHAWYGDVRSVASKPGSDGSLETMRKDLAGAIRFVNERLPEGSVIVSDPVTSYVLSAFSRARVVAVLGQHGNPRDRYAIERLSAVHAVMSPFTPQPMMMYAVRKFGVDYVVVNASFDSPYHDYLADWDPAAKTVLDEKIGSFTEAFAKVYSTEEIAVYRVLGTDFRATTWDPEIPFTRPTRFDLEACEPGGSAGTVRVASLGVNPRPALPGERALLTAVYRREPGPRPTLPLSLQLRFEDDAYFDRALRFPGDKYVRRFRERQDGEMRRFRVDRTPFLGYFRPEEWPEEHDCYDTFELHLPSNLGEKTYRVKWRLVEETLLPNFSVRDFIYNDDSFEGSPCAEIEVRRHVVR